MARMLRYGTSRNIVLVIPDIENPFYSHILHNLNRTIKENEYFCLLIETKTNSGWYEYLENAILSDEIEIAIICYEDLPVRNPALDKRMILLNEYFIEGIHGISINFYQAVVEAVQRLAKKGYKKIIHIRSNIDKTTFALRKLAFEKTCEVLGIDNDEMVVSSYSSNNLGEVLEKEKHKLPFPIAFLCDDDMLASGIYIFAQRNTYRIGREIGIIGMDDIFLCNFFYPRLSSYGYDITLLTDRIMEMIEHITTNKEQISHVSIDMKLTSFDSY